MENDNPPSNIENCSCPKLKKEQCPLDRRCLDKNIIYQAIVHNTTENKKETYIGLTANAFKDRLSTHKQSFKNRNVNQTTLSNHVWELKDKGVNFDIQYKILDRGKPYAASYKNCSLCIKEKTWIITEPLMATLNKRNELTSKCRHRDKFLLCNYKI